MPFSEQRPNKSLVLWRSLMENGGKKNEKIHQVGIKIRNRPILAFSAQVWTPWREAQTTSVTLDCGSRSVFALKLKYYPYPSSCSFIFYVLFLFFSKHFCTFFSSCLGNPASAPLLLGIIHTGGTRDT